MDEFLELFFKPSGVLSLVKAIIISSFILRVGHRFKCVELIVMDKRCIFTKSLMGTTMQDGGIRERSNVAYALRSVYYTSWFLS